ncbi:MAG TPA: hypothetical protein VMW54_15520 [Terriglobia bacterium]|nr:hypothetical protein [Terriglobia bacterium]
MGELVGAYQKTRNVSSVLEPGVTSSCLCEKVEMRGIRLSELRFFSVACAEASGRLYFEGW